MKYNAFIKRGFLRRGLQFLPVLALLSNLDVHAALEKTDSFTNSRSLINITGTVVDQDGKPIPGATVLIKGTTTGVKTDENGVFRLNIPPDKSIIVVSYVGYEGQEIDVAGQSTITIRLESSAAIDEVVVTGYGTQKRSEIVGSIATVKGEELMDIPAPNIAAALRNRIAGLGVSQNVGSPGASVRLNIRNSSTSPNAPAGVTDEPLYIVDGIIVERSTFDNLDAAMIENISVLKDASAAIYGASGAKGVMLVTTKRGKAGAPSISYNGYFGSSDAAFRPEMMSAYDHALLVNEVKTFANAPANEFFSHDDLEYIKGLNYKSWFDELWQPAFTQRHNVSVSGGSENVTFFVGGGYQNENANYPGMNFDKYTMRSGVSANMGKGFKADINFNVDHSVRNAKHNMQGEQDVRTIETLMITPQWVPMRIDGKLVEYTGPNRNPLGYLESDYYAKTQSRSYGINAALSYQPDFLKGFTAKLQIGQSSGGSNNRIYEAPFALYRFARFGQNGQLISTELDPDAPNNPLDVIAPDQSTLSPSLSENHSYQGFLTLQYANTFGKHSVDAILGGEQRETRNETMAARWRGQLIPGMDDWWAYELNSITQNGVTRGESAKRSFFGRLNYDWDKKYLLGIVARLDASSNFALGNRWGWSPSIGAGWVVSEEDFFKDNISFINFFKLKYNIGITGDDRVGARLWQERYKILTNAGYLFGDYNGNGLEPDVIPNPNITWEKKRTMNFGVEMSLFNNRLDIGAEFYQNKTFDGFDKGTNSLVPLYAGFLPPPVNYREVYDWGSEFTIGYKTRIGSQVNFNASMNFGYSNSMVSQVIWAPADLLQLNIEDGLAHEFGTDPRKYNTSNYGLIYKGTFRDQAHVDAFMAENPNYRIENRIPEPGWMYYEDMNGDGMINTYDNVPMFERTTPIFAGGITLGASYKDFSFSTNINARIGGKQFYDGRARIAASATRNVLTLWEDRWTPDNPDGFMPRFDDPYLTKNSTFWAVNGTMVRINNMTLTYKVPNSIANRIGLSGARVLATGNNLWTLVNPLKYKDPYTTSAYDYPIVRTISLGISASL